VTAVTAIVGGARYARFIARRERVTSTVWIVCLAVSAWGFAAMYPGLFTDPTQLLAIAQTMNSPSMVALMGPVYGLDHLTTAMVMSQECLIWFQIVVAIMNIFFVNRHTRDDEELGRLEVLRALPVGRLANPVATMATAFALNLVIALATTAGLLAVNISGTTLAGAFAYGLAIGVIGFLFAGLTLLTAQLFSTTRGTVGWAFAILGLFYALRASGDMSDNVLSYISPMGLGLRTYAFDANHFWPLAVLLLEAIALAAVGLAICARRDLGEGVIPARPGRRTASRFLQGPFGLAWRLGRRTVYAWAAGGFFIGLMYGSVIGELDDFVASNQTIQDMLDASGTGQTMLDNYIAMIFSVIALIAAVPVISAASKIRSEEKHGRLEQLFAKPLPRVRLYGAYLAIALIHSIAFPLLSALGLYGAGAGQVDLGPCLAAALTYLPALWATMGLTVLLVGLVPKLSALIWAVFAYSFLLVYFGRLFKAPEWSIKVSPFGNIAQLPVQAFSIWPLVVLTVLAAALTAGGLAAYRRRDIG
jgi:ABC-2 type transport system permease protein